MFKKIKYKKTNSQSCVWAVRHEDGVVSCTKQFKVKFKERFGWPFELYKEWKTYNRVRGQ